jgi:hypothetical protein
MTDPNHPFATTLEQMRKKGSGGFARLTERQQWEWHADVYAFRRVMLEVSNNVHVSPPDPEGWFFDPVLVARAEAWYRHKYIEPKQHRKQANGDDLEREGRDLVTQWVRSHGYISIDAYCAQHDGDALAAHRDYLKSPEFGKSRVAAE